MKGKLKITPSIRDYVIKYPRVYRTILLYQLSSLYNVYGSTNVTETNVAFRRFFSRSDVGMNHVLWLEESKEQREYYGALILCAIHVDILKACGRNP